MPTYMDIHDGFVGVNQEQFEEAHRRDLAVQDEEGVSYDHAWLDPDSGRAFCLVTGPTKEAVIRVHERAGHPASEVYELSIQTSQALPAQETNPATLVLIKGVGWVPREWGTHRIPSASPTRDLGSGEWSSRARLRLIYR